MPRQREAAGQHRADSCAPWTEMPLCSANYTRSAVQVNSSQLDQAAEDQRLLQWLGLTQNEPAAAPCR